MEFDIKEQIKQEQEDEDVNDLLNILEQSETIITETAGKLFTTEGQEFIVEQSHRIEIKQEPSIDIFDGHPGGIERRVEEETPRKNVQESESFKKDTDDESEYEEKTEAAKKRERRLQRTLDRMQKMYRDRKKETSVDDENQPEKVEVQQKIRESTDGLKKHRNDMANRRKTETTDEREKRLIRQRESMRRHREKIQNGPVEQRELKRQRAQQSYKKYLEKKRSIGISAAKKERIEKFKIYWANRLKNETSEEREQRKMRHRECTRRFREKIKNGKAGQQQYRKANIRKEPRTDMERKAANEYRKKWMDAKRSNETAEEREQRLLKRRESGRKYRERMINGTIEQQELFRQRANQNWRKFVDREKEKEKDTNFNRLKKNIEEKRKNETAEEREQRLQRRRESNRRYKEKIRSGAVERLEYHRQRRCEYAKKYYKVLTSNETPEEREMRLKKRNAREKRRGTRRAKCLPTVTSKQRKPTMLQRANEIVAKYLENKTN